VGVVGAFTVLLFYFFSVAGWDPPPEVAAAITTLIAAAGVELRIYLSQRRKSDGSAKSTKPATS